MNEYRGCCTLSVFTIRRGVIRFTFRPLELRYPLDKNVSRQRSWTSYCGEKKNRDPKGNRTCNLVWIPIHLGMTRLMGGQLRNMVRIPARGQSAVHWIPGFFPRGVVQWWYEGHHSLPSSTKVRSEWKHSYTHPHACMDHDTRWMGGWLDPKAGLDALLKRSIDQS